MSLVDAKTEEQAACSKVDHEGGDEDLDVLPVREVVNAPSLGATALT